MTIRFAKGEDQGGGWTPLPRGSYAIELQDFEEGVSSNGNTQIKLKGAVIEGPYAGKNVTIWYTFTAKAAWRFTALCEALGVQLRHEGKDGEGNDVYAAEPAELMGKIAVFDVTVRKDDKGNDQNDFNKPRAYGSQVGAPGQQASAPAQGFAPPQGFGPPQGMPQQPPQGFAPPQQQYQQPPAQQYAQPPQGYPQQGGAPQMGPPAGFAPPPQGFGPPPGYQQPPQQGYPQQQGQPVDRRPRPGNG